MTKTTIPVDNRHWTDQPVVLMEATHVANFYVNDLGDIQVMRRDNNSPYPFTVECQDATTVLMCIQWLTEKAHARENKRTFNIPMPTGVRVLS